MAMTGDGVNDVLALKDADVGVAMGSGSAATRSVAQLVLLDNRFAVLPDVVAEGRKVIGNIERVAKLFLTKTVYGALMAVTVGIVGLPFPFLPRHLTLVTGADDRHPGVRPGAGAEPRPGGARHGRPRPALQHPGRRDRHRLLVRQLLGGRARTSTRRSSRTARRRRSRCSSSASAVLVAVARPLVPWKVGPDRGDGRAVRAVPGLPFTREFFALEPGVWQDTASDVLVAVAGGAGVLFIGQHTIPRRSH